jgi:probable rRNA maturation factor
MILLDPDLDPDPALCFGASSPDPQAAGHAMRLPSTRTLARFLREAQAAVRLKGQVCVLLTTDAKMRRLNRQFRGKNKPTDVLSFPASGAVRSETAGDLSISVGAARRAAAELGHSLAAEIKVLMLHGLLHLAGFDHESDSGEMARREIRLRARLRLPVGLIERGGDYPTPAPRSRRKNGAPRQSRFPAGMTERKATAGPSTAVAAATFAQEGAPRESRFPAGMTERKATAGPSTGVAAATFAQDDKRDGVASADGAQPTLRAKSRAKDGAPARRRAVRA